MQVIIKAQKSYWSWYDNAVTVFEKRISVPVNGLVDFVVPGSKVIQTAKSLSLQVSNCCCGLCFGYTL